MSKAKFAQPAKPATSQPQASKGGPSAPASAPSGKPSALAAGIRRMNPELKDAPDDEILELLEAGLIQAKQAAQAPSPSSSGAASSGGESSGYSLGALDLRTDSSGLVQLRVAPPTKSKIKYPAIELMPAFDGNPGKLYLKAAPGRVNHILLLAEIFRDDQILGEVLGMQADWYNHHESLDGRSDAEKAAFDRLCDAVAASLESSEVGKSSS